MLLSWIEPSKLNWNYFSRSQNAIDLLLVNPVKIRKLINEISCSTLSINSDAISLLKTNQDRINWCKLSVNPNALHLLKHNKDNIDWIMICLKYLKNI